MGVFIGTLVGVFPGIDLVGSISMLIPVPFALSALTVSFCLKSFLLSRNSIAGAILIRISKSSNKLF